MNELKNKIVKLLEDNKKSGYYALEIADLLEEPISKVAYELKNNDTFFYDKNNPYIGWRLSKYKDIPLVLI